MSEENSEAGEISVEKQKELARWSVGRTMEEITDVATVIGMQPSDIYRWRRKYVTEEAAPDPVGPLRDFIERGQAAQRAVDEVIAEHELETHEKETNGMGKEDLTEAKKAEIAKWSVGKSEKEIAAKAKTLGYQSPATIYKWRTDLLAPSDRGAGKAALPKGLRDKAIALAQRVGAAETASRMGLKRTTVQTWMARAAKAEEEEAERAPKDAGSPATGGSSAIRGDTNELRKLRLENTLLHALLADAKAQGYAVPFDLVRLVEK